MHGFQIQVGWFWFFFLSVILNTFSTRQLFAIPFLHFWSWYGNTFRVMHLKNESLSLACLRKNFFSFLPVRHAR